MRSTAYAKNRTDAQYSLIIIYSAGQNNINTNRRCLGNGAARCRGCPSCMYATSLSVAFPWGDLCALGRKRKNWSHNREEYTYLLSEHILYYYRGWVFNTRLLGSWYYISGVCVCVCVCNRRAGHAVMGRENSSADLVRKTFGDYSVVVGYI